MEKFGTLNELFEVFDHHIIDWVEDEPDWNKLGREFCVANILRPTELKAITLLDLWRFLPLLAARRLELENTGALDQVESNGGTGALNTKDEVHPAARWAKEGDDWKIEFGGRTVRINSLDGAFYYQQILLKTENSSIRSEDLHGLLNNPNYRYVSKPQATHDPILDDDSIKNIPEVISDRRKQIVDAKAKSDLTRQVSLEKELYQIEKYFAGAKVPGGRRGFATPERKLRENIRKSLNRLRRELREKTMNDLAVHLQQSVTVTGPEGWTYRPIPQVNWIFTND